MVLYPVCESSWQRRRVLNVSKIPDIIAPRRRSDYVLIAYPMIGALLIGCTLFARNSLRGQPVLQQRLMKLPIYVALGSDVSDTPNDGTTELTTLQIWL